MSIGSVGMYTRGYVYPPLPHPDMGHGIPQHIGWQAGGRHPVRFFSSFFPVKEGWNRLQTLKSVKST